MAAHDNTLLLDEAKHLHVSMGISEHALGTSFDKALRPMRSALPENTSFAVRLGQFAEIGELFETGEIDFAVIRREGTSLGGQVLGDDPLVWRASPDCATRRGPLYIS